MYFKIIFPSNPLRNLMGFPRFFMTTMDCRRIARFLLIRTKDPRVFIATEAFLRFSLIRFAYTEGLAYGPIPGFALYLLLSRRKGLEEGDASNYKNQNFYKMLHLRAVYQISLLLDSLWDDILKIKRHRFHRDIYKILEETITKQMGGKDSFLNDITRVVKDLPKGTGFHFVTFDLRTWTHDLQGAYDLIEKSVQRVKCFGAMEYSIDGTSIVPHMHFIFKAPNKHLLNRIKNQDIAVHQKSSYANQPWPWRQFNAACYLMKDYLGESKWSKQLPYPLISTFRKKKKKSSPKKVATSL